MGILISRFRKKKSTLEILESLESELKSIESYSRQTERRHKTIVGHLLLFSVGAYVMVAGFFYFFFFPASLYDQLLYVVPLLLFPVIIVFLKRGISWWYHRKISKNQEKYVEIQQQKKQLLEEVMDKETYKVAKQILEKFAPDQLRKGPSLAITPAVARNNSEGAQVGMTPLNYATPMGVPMRPPVPVSTGTELRYRNVGSPARSDISETPAGRSILFGSPVSSVSASPLQSPVSAPMLTAGLSVSQSNLTRPILAANRSIMDRLVEYLVGDGVNQRYALICRNCNSHNGMALKEEFEFLAFRCCYCFHWNPARKQRLQAPKLEASLGEKSEQSESSDPSGESNHQSEDEENELEERREQTHKHIGHCATEPISETGLGTEVPISEKVAMQNTGTAESCATSEIADCGAEVVSAKDNVVKSVH